MARIMLLFKRVMPLFKRIITLWGRERRLSMQDELELEMGRLKYDMARDIIISIINSLPNQNFSDNDIKIMKCIELNKENQK
jgi:hypothetical protein